MEWNGLDWNGMDKMGEKSNGCISLIMWKVICENEANHGKFLGNLGRIKKAVLELRELKILSAFLIWVDWILKILESKY